MVCLKYRRTKPIEEEEHWSLKAESITLATRYKPSAAPRYHFTAGSLTKLSNNKLAVCLRAALIGALEHHGPPASITGCACTAEAYLYREGWVFGKLFAEESSYQKDKQLVQFGSLLSSIQSNKSNWALTVSKKQGENISNQPSTVLGSGRDFSLTSTSE